MIFSISISLFKKNASFNRLEIGHMVFQWYHRLYTLEQNERETASTKSSKADFGSDI